MVRVAVVGVGWWGQVVIRLLAQSTRLRVVKGVTLESATVADFARAHGIGLTEDYAEVLRDPQVDAVILCTPHSLHADQIVAAAHAGKHVFCEKPLALTRADAERALAAVNAGKLTFAIGHERRFEPPILELMRSLRAGELGVPLQIEANFSQDKFLALAQDNWRCGVTDAPAGPMTATGIHLLDLAVSVFGEAQWVFTSVKRLGSQLPNGDTLAALVGFKRGGHALISAILATPFEGRFAVYGSKGWIEVRDNAHPDAPQGWTLTRVIRGSEKTRVTYPPVSAVLANLEAFADAVEGRAPYPVPQSEMIANIAALEAVIESAARGERVQIG